MARSASKKSSNKSQSNQGSSQSDQSQNQAPEVHPAIAESREAGNFVGSNVQPIEVVRNKPEVDNEEAETVRSFNRPNLQQVGAPLEDLSDDEANKPKQEKVVQQKALCWNCANHNKTTELDENGVCGECGFETEKLYNGELEARKAHQRALDAAQY